MPETWRRYLRFWRPNVERDVDDEMRFHFDMREREYVAAGLSPEEAHAETLRRFGDVDGVRSSLYHIGHQRQRRMRVTDLAGSVRNDVVFAVRQLARSRGFTAIVVLTLGLAIGATSAIFSVVDGVLLRPLPYPDADRLLLVWESDRFSATTREDASVPDYFDLREQNRSFAAVGAFEEQPFTLTASGAEPVRLVAGTVSRNLLGILGVSPRLGRGFSANEDVPGGARAAMLGDRLWRTRFGADRAVLGSVIHLDGEPYTVVGVLPEDVAFPAEKTDLWVPLQQGPQSMPRENHVVKVIGRLQPGVTVRGAQAEVSAIAQRLEAEYPGANKGRGMSVEPLPTALFSTTRPALFVLLGAVVLVLLVACANVANLLLARAMVRQREVAVRAALGAGAGRLARQFFIESLLMTLAAAGVGLIVATLGLKVLLAAAPPEIPRLGNVGINLTVLAFTLGLAVIVSLGFGLVPTFSALSLDLQRVLRSGGRTGTPGRYHQRLRDMLVVSELALAVVLVVGAGLLMRSFWTLRHVDPGFNVENVLHASLQLPASRYPQSYSNYPHWTRITGFQDRVIERVSAIPGVLSVAFASAGPLDPGFTNSFRIVGREAEAAKGQAEISTRFVTPGYFATVGVPLLRGRPLSDRDGVDAPSVAVINAAAAKKYFPGEDAIGHRLSYWGQAREIVGIVGDERFHGLTEPTPAAVYTPLAQTPTSAVTLLARTSGDPVLVIGAVRREVWSVDGDIALFDVGTIQAALSGSVARQRFTMLLLGVFAAAATVLALLGVYGVLTYTVAQRTGEMGIRVALGARRSEIVGLVLRRGIVLLVMGLGVGLVAALAGSRVLAHLLYGIGAMDPLTYVAASVAIVAVALGASYVPARRAAGVEPMVALRGE
jgi:putative ABC transport system permease protein